MQIFFKFKIFFIATNSVYVWRRIKLKKNPSPLKPHGWVLGNQRHYRLRANVHDHELQQKPLHTLETMRTPLQIKHTRKKDIYIHPYSVRQLIIINRITKTIFNWSFLGPEYLGSIHVLFKSIGEKAMEFGYYNTSFRHIKQDIGAIQYTSELSMKYS